MTNNIVREEVLYTYEAAINRYERERHHEWLCRQKRLNAIKEKQKAKRCYYLNQKLYGFAISVLSFIILLLGGDAFAICGIVAGVAIMITKKMVIYNDYYCRCKK